MNFTALNNLIKSSKKEITLNEDVILEDSEECAFKNGIVIDHDLNIDAKGHCINANGKATVFYIGGGNVSIKNLTIKNAVHKRGGAIYAYRGFVNIKNCIFKGNTASDSYGGGAIYIRDSSVDIRNSSFIENSSFEYGGAIYNCADMNLFNCSFTKNHVEMALHPEIDPSRGGAIFNDNGKINVDSCDFTQNIAKCHGVAGAICNEKGDCIVKNSIFMANTQGCISGGNFTVSNCIFADDGLSNSGGFLKISKSGFIDKDRLIKPGVSRASILKNLKKNLCECSDKTIDAHDIHFINDDEKYILSNTGVCHLVSTKFEKHHIIDNQTLMYLLESEKDDVIDQIDNDLKIKKGGVFFINDIDSQSMNRFVGLIEDESADEIFLDFDVVISQDKGPVNIERDNLTIDGRGHVIDANFSSIFNISGNNVTLKNMTFKNGLADIGSAITNHGNDLTISNCQFQNNRARKGGAIYNYSSNLQVEKSTFKSNSLLGNGEGGSIFNHNGASGFILDCEFIKSMGGAIHNEGKLTVKYSKFIENNATFEGGAICNLQYLNVEKSRFVKNASKSGGAIKNYNDLSVKDCTFEGGKSHAGAGIYNLGKSLTVEKSRFIKNSVVESGGAIYNSSKSDLLIVKDCYFEDNLRETFYGYSTPPNKEKYSIFSGSKNNYIINCEFVASYDGEDIHADHQVFENLIENDAGHTEEKKP